MNRHSGVLLMSWYSLCYGNNDDMYIIQFSPPWPNIAVIPEYIQWMGSIVVSMSFYTNIS